MIIALLAASVESGAQGPEIKFEHLSIVDGLSQNTVRAILQDHRGFLWFATQDGLNRYDGYDFKIFRPDPDDPQSISSSDILCLYEDSRNELWVGTDRGLNRYNHVTEKFERFFHVSGNRESLSNDYVTTIREQAGGTLWIGSQKGLTRLELSTGKLGRFDPWVHGGYQLRDELVSEILVEGNEIWVGTRDGGLYHIDSESGIGFRFASQAGGRGALSGINVTSVVRDGNGTLWVGTRTGLNQFISEEKGFRRFLRNDAIPGSVAGDAVRRLYCDAEGRLWVGTESGLSLYEAESDRFTNYRWDPADPGSLNADAVWSIYEDRSQILWVGSSGAGLNKYDKKKAQFRHFRGGRGTKGLSGKNVWSVSGDRLGRLWIGTDNGLNRFDPSTGGFKLFENEPGNKNSLNDNRVFSILEDRNGFIWIGTWEGGLNRFDPGAGKFIQFEHDPSDPSSLSGNDVLCIAEDASGVLWIGTFSAGLNKMDANTGRFTRYTHDHGNRKSLSNNSVRFVTETSGGDFWVATDGGLNLFDRASGSFEVFRHDPGNPRSLSNDVVLTLFEDRDGTLWVGTHSGLNKTIEKEGSIRFETWDERRGLANNAVLGILQDERNRLWITTNHGLSRFDPVSGQFRNFYESNGLQSDEFNAGAAFRFSDDRLAVGGVNGFNIFHPDSIRDNPHIPQIVLTRFSKFGLPVISDSSISELSCVNLHWSETVFSFSFAALDFSAPKKNVFAYRLEGFDDRWIQLGNKNDITFTNLDAGKYLLRIIGANSDGIWNRTGAQLEINVLSPWWKTWWARTLGVTALLILIVAGYRIRIGAVQKQKAQLEKLVNERTADVFRKSRQLERIVSIVKTINTEIDFRRLLGAMLEEMSALKGVERSTVLVLDEPAGLFRFEAFSVWNQKLFEGVHLTLEEAEERYTKDAEEIYEDVFVARRTSRKADEKLPDEVIPKSMMIVRIRVEGTVVGYLVLDNLTDENAFDDQDLEVLGNLKEHLVSAFIKTRLLEEKTRLLENLALAQESLIQRERFAVLGQLTGVVSHELRNPLGTIRASLFTIQEKTSGRGLNLERAVERMERNILRCDRIIDELLDYARTTSLHLETTDIDEYLTEFASEYPVPDGIKVELSLQSDCVAEIDRDRFRRCLNNVVENACHALQESGRPEKRLNLTAKKSNGRLNIEVSDNGSGINEADIVKVFEPLFSTKSFGVGLGLPIVRQIMEQHSGGAEMKSVLGEKTTITLWLPA